MKPVLAWHFVGDTLRNGCPIPPDGEWLEYPFECVMCELGLHASRHPFDALQYAPGATLCLVEVEQIDGEINDDKLVCHRRKIIARMDATEMLRYYARMQAVSVIHLWNAPDVVLDYLMTGDESFRDTAREAAWNAARAAAREALREAAWEAAWSAGRAAARDAAWDAAREAAKEAAREAARTAMWEEAGNATSTARNVVRAAAWTAALAAARNDFADLVYECFADYLP